MFQKKCNVYSRKKGIKVVTGAKVLPETLVKDNGVTIQAEHNGENKEFKAEKCLYL